MPNAETDRVWSLIKEIQIAMVVTHDGHGDHLRARPMAARVDDEKSALYFLTDASAAKDDEIIKNPNVCIVFADIKGQKYVSVTGEARVTDDRSHIKKFWSVFDRAFWKDADDPAIRLLKVTPRAAEFWEGPGLVVGYAKMVGAAVTGGRPDLGENKKVAI